jgi:DNA polymerase kappa
MAENSLARRLAGQSVTKAGLQHDQTEINRIIMEASKGSKFYENERKKDEELTEKINKLTAKKEDMMDGVDVGKVVSVELVGKAEVYRGVSSAARIEAGVDHTVGLGDCKAVQATTKCKQYFQIDEIEALRDLSQYICHVDCDAFYASVEVRKFLSSKAFH